LCTLCLLLAVSAEARAEAGEPGQPAESAASVTPTDDGKLLFNFRYQPWQEVLDWFADQAGLSLVLEAPPTGTFNYHDSRRYTPAEALDVLNSVLLTKGYTLVRNGRMLVLVNLEDGVPPNLVPDVPLAELDQRGEYELIRVLFPVWNMTAEQAAAEVKPLLGPQGSIVVLPQARQIQVTETGGRLRTISSVINAVEQPDQGTAGMRRFSLHYLTIDVALPTIRQMLGIPDEAFSTPDGTLQITRSAVGEGLLVRGTAQHVARLEEVLRLIDVPEASAGIAGAPQLEVYPVTSADPEAVLKVLQQLFEKEPVVRLASDPQTGYVVAVARPAQQATIRATISQMQKDAREIDVIGLSNVDPQVAVLAVNKLFGSLGDEADPAAPRVDADLTTRSLLVRGTASQVEQIRDLLRKLGESDEAGMAASQQKVRLVPLSGAAARSAIGQIEQIWPTLRGNRIRVVTPAATIPTYRPSESTREPGGRPPTEAIDGTQNEAMQQLWQMFLDGEQSSAAPPVRGQETRAQREAGVEDDPARRTGDEDDPARETSPLEEDRGASRSSEAQANFRLIHWAQYAADQPATTNQESTQAKPETKAPIVVAPGPGGVLIASEDLKALDEFEELLTTLAGRTGATGREYAVFYLKYAKATTMAEVLAALFGGRTSGRQSGLIGDIAGAALGDVGGGLMGNLLLGGGGGGSVSTASIDMVPDMRLNALVVRARPADLDTIEQLLKVLDQRAGPEEVEADAVPRIIPVYNTSASQVAAVVQQVYQDRMSGSAMPMSPQDMLKMIRGNGPSVDQQAQKMSIGIDERSNSLVVRAPDALFEEVKALVAKLDEGQLESPETTRVVSLSHTNSAAVEKALSSLLGTAVSTSGGSAAAQRNEQQSRSRDNGEREVQRQMRRQMEMLRQLQNLQRMQERSQDNRGGRGGPPGGGPPGFGPGGGPPGSGPPGGGRGG
jgi:type II secretory pathway component GspD/PulD (secretin)